jgi:hypothetical protein
MQETKIPVIRTSARTGSNVDDSFLDMTKQLIIKKNEQGVSAADDRKRGMGNAFSRMQLGKDGSLNTGNGGGMCGCGL